MRGEKTEAFLRDVDAAARAARSAIRECRYATGCRDRGEARHHWWAMLGVRFNVAAAEERMHGVRLAADRGRAGLEKLLAGPA